MSKRKSPTVKQGLRKPPFWFYLSFLAIPLIFFTLLEISLRLFSYGRDNNQWIDIDENTQILNPEIAYRYFSETENIPFAVEAIMDRAKDTNTIRFFTLGASSAAGYPYMSSGSFSKYVRKGLEYRFPEKKIESVNISMAAINSYAVKDLLRGVLEKEPDFILIYLGHNEYYGALGVASTETGGSSPMLIDLNLRLQRFKVYELLNDIIKSAYGLFSQQRPVSRGTLMAEIAGEKLIRFGSEIYMDGVEQFRSNLGDILSMCRESDIPVIIGTLVSNLKDQPPFISLNESGLPPAQEIYEQGLSELKKMNIEGSDSLFRYAKDLDALRFRAPGEFNRIIKALGKQYGYPVVSFDSLFNYHSTERIAGNDLLTDHLHPNLKGYKLMGRYFLEGLAKYSFLREEAVPSYTGRIDSLIEINFNFTALDSAAAIYRIALLKNDWPFVKNGGKLTRNQILRTENFTDSVAAEMLDGKISRREARIKSANYYLRNGRYNEFSMEMKALLEEFPFLKSYYRSTAEILIKLNQFEEAFYFLNAGSRFINDPFFFKWMGIIELNRNNVLNAVKYLEKSLAINNKDSQVYYNLAGAYSDLSEFQKALDAVNRSLAIQPGNARAENLKSQLLQILSRENSR